MVDTPLYSATYRLVTPLPAPLWHGEALLLNIEVCNTGTIPWLTFGQNPVNLTYLWCYPDGRPLTTEGPRTALPCPVPPATRTNIEIHVTAPPEPGTYHLIVGLVEERIAWFSERDVAPLVVPITYQPATAPRVCILNGNCVIHDAVGNHVVSQIRALRDAGYHTLLLTEVVDHRLPADVRRSMVELRFQDLEHPGDRTRIGVEGVEHFFAADVLIVNYSTYYELAHAIKLAPNSVIIFDYHGVTPTALWDPNSPGYNDLVRGHRDLQLVQYADYGYGHSPYTASELIATGLIPPERVGVLPYAVVEESGYGQLPDPALMEQYDLYGKYVLLYIGRMARNKRIHDLVEALPQITQHYPNLVLLLVGNNQFGPFQAYAAEVVARAQELGCAEQVIFTGQVPAVEPFYDLCHLFVTASIHEGFGMPAVEAMAHGKPVIAANITASPQIIADGGVVFTPEDPDDLASKVLPLLRDVPPHPDRTVATDQPGQFVHPLQRLSWQHNSSTLQTDRKIGLVAPRYGSDILGGAERLIRDWAEQLARRGYPVELLTTCTAHMGDWTNHYEPGVAEINGVTVRRFATTPVDPGVFHVVQLQANHGERVSYIAEQAFAANNLQSTDLVAHLRAHAAEYAAVIFAPYLFGTTYWGAQAVPDKALIAPCLHDEAAARFAIFREMLEGAAGLLFNTAAEGEFAWQKLGVANPAHTVVGYGFDPETLPGDGGGFRQRYNLPDEILLYSGRLESGKNVPLLLDYFLRYKAEHPGPLTLVLTGRGDVLLPDRPDVVPVGMLPEAELPDAFAAATVFCQPSLHESFSIVMMEAWLQQCPVLAHAHSPVTSQHVELSNGGYTFTDYASFRDVLARLQNNPAHAAELGRNGRAYVIEHYAWDSVIDRLLTSINTFTQSRSAYVQLSQRGVQRALSFTRSRFNDALLQVVADARQESLRLDAQQRQQLRAAARLDPAPAPANEALAHHSSHNGAPLFKRLLTWGQQQLRAAHPQNSTAPALEQQAQFNQQLLQTMLPMLERSLAEQRRLQREIATLRSQLVDRETIDET